MAEWFAGRVEDFTEDVRTIVEIDGSDVVVLRAGEKFHAVANTCLHMGGPVGEGLVMGRVCAVLDEQKRLVREEFSQDSVQIVCPWHGWAYDIDSGAFAGDERLRLRTYPVQVREDGVYVIA
ncbi:MAG: Rieske 2Fe-2S domain-containing protein [Nitriliruptorales bacterium]|nr:Rieske 2Fe-2S domain-containing protein [Nitriliruptorales bacterium]